MSSPPSDIWGGELERLRLISENPAPMPLIGELRRAGRSITDRATLHTRSALPCHTAKTWGDLKLADALSRVSTNESKIGKTAESAPIVGIPEQESENAGHRSKRGIQAFADWGAKLNFLRNGDLSSRLAAAGVRCWGVLRDAT